MPLSPEFWMLIEQMKEHPIPVVVEGINDKKALEELGVKNIITLHKKPIYQIIEELPGSEVAILTDLDKEGKKLYGILAQECSRRGIKVNNRLRNFLMRETELSHMEGLLTFIERTEEK